MRPTQTGALAKVASRFAKAEGGFPYPSITDFVTSPSGLNQQIFPAQRFFLKVFEKEDLDDTIQDVEIRDKFNDKTLYRLTERGYYDFLRGEGRFSLDYDTYRNNPVVQLILNMGRRASKSTMIGMWISTKLAQLLVHDQPQLYFHILPTDPMNVSLTALGEDNAIKLFGKLASMIKGAPYFQPFMLAAPDTQGMKLWTRHDQQTMRDKLAKSSDAHTHSINITAQSNSPGVRGDNNIFCVLEEFAHFNQAKTRKAQNERQLDEIIYEALSPSVSGFRNPDGSPFGKTLLITSPNGKQGKYYAEYEAAFRLGVDSYTLAMSAPTWEINPLVQTSFLRKAYNQSPTTYEQEYGAKLLDGGMAWLRDLPKFYLSFTRDAPREPTYGRLDRTYYLGIDFALTKDATAYAICHYEPFFRDDPEALIDEAHHYNDEQVITDYLHLDEHPRGAYVVDLVVERFAGKPPYAHRTTLLMEDLLDELDHLFKVWPISGGIYDQWSGELITQLLQSRGLGQRLTMVNFSELGNDNLAKLFSEMLHAGRLKMPDDKPLRGGLLALQVEHRAHDVIKVEAPPGAHDDFFSAVTRALWLCHAAQTKNFVLAGHKLNLNLGPGANLPLNLANVRNERLAQKIRDLRTQSAGAPNLRNPAQRTNLLRTMRRGM